MLRPSVFTYQCTTEHLLSDLRLRFNNTWCIFSDLVWWQAEATDVQEWRIHLTVPAAVAHNFCVSAALGKLRVTRPIQYSQEALSVSKFVALFLKSLAKVCPGLHLHEIQWITSPCSSDDFWEYSAAKCDSSFLKQWVMVVSLLQCTVTLQ